MSSVVSGINTKFFHPCQQGRSIDTQARGSSVSAAHTALRFGECTHNRVALFPTMLVSDNIVSM